MKTYVWTIVVLTAIDIVGKGLMLYQQDLQRKPGLMVCDMAIGLVFIVWGAYLLGNEFK